MPGRRTFRPERPARHDSLQADIGFQRQFYVIDKAAQESSRVLQLPEPPEPKSLIIHKHNRRLRRPNNQTLASSLGFGGRTAASDRRSAPDPPAAKVQF